MKVAEHLLKEDKTLGGDAAGGGRGRFSGGWVIDTDLHGSPRALRQKTPYAQSKNWPLSKATKE